MRLIITFCLLLIIRISFSQQTASSDSIASMLHGRRGCGIIPATQQPVEKPKVFIRCGMSNYNNEPLFVIDGIVVDAKEIKELDPKDIASIDILKAATATAIYGCRASDGVIIITTKNSNLRKFIIKDFLDGSHIAGATVTFISQDDKKDTMMFVADDSGIVKTDRIKYGRRYRAIVSSVGYRTLYGAIEESKSQQLLLKRDTKVCNEVIVIGYGRTIRCWDNGVKIIEGYEHLEKDKPVTYVNLYPNPVQKGSTVTIDLKNETGEDLQLKVFSLDGRLLLSQTKKTVKGNNRFTVHADNNWSPGTYLVQVSGAKGKPVSTDKLIIQ